MEIVKRIINQTFNGLQQHILLQYVYGVVFNSCGGIVTISLLTLKTT